MDRLSGIDRVSAATFSIASSRKAGGIQHIRSHTGRYQTFILSAYWAQRGDDPPCGPRKADQR
jgi:hypothetical protein